MGEGCLVRLKDWGWANINSGEGGAERPCGGDGVPSKLCSEAVPEILSQAPRFFPRTFPRFLSEGRIELLCLW